MQPNSNSLRETIKSTARRLFSQEGYDQTTLDDILKELAISSHTFFSIFHSKDELLEVVWSEQ